MKAANCTTHRGQPIDANHRPMRYRIMTLVMAAAFGCTPVWANPTGAQVVAGQVTFSTNGNILTVTNSPGSIINWLNFSIGAGQTTQFLQQSSASAVLNRIVGQNPSQILGSLTSNGKVYLINPNGILFGRGSQVDVGSLYASTLNLTDDDFRSGKNNFAAAQAAPGSVVNQGSITTPTGGNIYLIAPQVQNAGLLRSPQGDIILAAGHSVQLVDGADPNIQVVVSAGSDQALNIGQVLAQGGKVGIYGALINQNGVVNADSAVAGQNGMVVLKSSQSTALGNGSVTSAAGTGNDSVGGTVDVLGNQVTLSGTALVDVSGHAGGGKVMIGGDFHGANAAIPDASSVFIGADVQIRADAINTGNGGSVAVWSDQATTFDGTISAMGGAQGGSGGYVETSGRNLLRFDGMVNLLAPKGSIGTLLLDPYTVTISDDTSYSPQVPASGSGPFTYTSNATSYISTAALNSELNYSNVTINSTGSITVNSATPVAWANSTLTIAAGSDIYINSAINAATGTLVLNSTAGNISQNLTSGAINVGSLSAVATAGNVTLLNQNNAVSALSGSARGSGGFQFYNGSTSGLLITYAGNTAGITTTAGDVQIQAQGDINVNEPVNSAGNIALTSLQGQLLIQSDLTAQNVIALQANGMIDQVTSDIAPVITAANLSAVSNSSYVSLGNASNNISGSIAGSAGAGDPNGNAFLFVTSGAVTVGSVPAVGSNGAVNGITVQNGAVILNALSGNLTMAAGLTGAGAVTLEATNGSIVQSGTGQITSSGPLSLSASRAIGASGAGNSLLTNVGSLSASGTDVYVSNAATGTLALNQVSGSGVVNISTAGALTTAGITGGSITLVSGGNMTIGNTTMNAGGGNGAIALYAGFTEAPGAAPQANGSSTVTLTEGGTFQAATVDFWANSYWNFTNPYTSIYSSINGVNYHPNEQQAVATAQATQSTVSNNLNAVVSIVNTLTAPSPGSLINTSSSQTGTSSSGANGNAPNVSTKNTTTKNYCD